MSEWQRAFAILGGSEQLFRICRTSPSESLFVWQPQNSAAKRRFARSDPFLVPRQMPVSGDLGHSWETQAIDAILGRWKHSMSTTAHNWIPTNKDAPSVQMRKISIPDLWHRLQLHIDNWRTIAQSRQWTPLAPPPTIITWCWIQPKYAVAGPSSPHPILN